MGRRGCSQFDGLLHFDNCDGGSGCIYFGENERNKDFLSKEGYTGCRGGPISRGQIRNQHYYPYCGQISHNRRNLLSASMLQLLVKFHIITLFLIPYTRGQ